MRDETRRKLDQLGRCEGIIAVIALTAMLVVAAIWFQPWWTPVQVGEVEGIVRFAHKYRDDSGNYGLTLQVALSDGRLVKAEAWPLVPLAPPVLGSAIKLSERRSWTGFRSYVWTVQ